MLILACVLLLLWVAGSFAETQLALQWWFRRHTLRTGQAAESIRNGLLQQSFSLRRNLELALVEPNPTANCKIEWQAQLALTEQLHSGLEAISDRLQPPYVDDNLPLALQHLLLRSPQATRLRLELQLPPAWRSETYQTSHTILTTLEELLTISLSHAHSELSVVSIQMKLRQALGELVVQFTYPSPTIAPHPSQVKEFAYLKRAFQLLTGGNCFYRCKKSTISWHFHW